MFFLEKPGVKAVRIAIGVLAGSITICHSAQAQESASATANVQRVEVTGSNIKRSAKEGTSPIQTLTKTEIRDSGAKTVNELMQQLTLNGTNGFRDTATQNSFSRGVSTASLRNLGATSTLILLNGRRMTPSAYANPNNGTSTLYDLNTIPISALDRVEVFKDGASAVYGSDAIAGVINFITKSNYQGVEISARNGLNDEGQFGKRGVSITGGTGDIESDGFNVFATVDYNKSDATTARQGSKDIQADQYALLNFRLNPFNSSISNQPFFFRERAPGSRSFRTGATAVNRIGCDPSRLLVGGLQYDIQPVRDITLFGRTFCNFDIDQFTDVQGKGEDLSTLARATFKINSTLSAFTEAAYTKSDRDFRAAPIAINGRFPVTNFLVGGLSAPFQAILPIGHPDNPFKDVRAATAYRFENLRGGGHQTNDNYRLLAGLKGQYGLWDWETAVLWNRSNRDDVRFGQLYLPTLRTLISQNRSLAAVAADPTLGIDVRNRGTAEILQYDAKAATEFGALQGGAIGFATGVEIRQEKIAITPDPVNANGDVYGLATTQVEGKRNVSSLFMELRTPWLKNFETDFAGRFDKYPGIKTNFVPKVGAKWTVNDMLSLRGSYAEGFRAPAVSQVSPGGAQFFLNNISDPLRCPDGLTPAKNGGEPADCNKSVSGVGGANPALKPETSKSYSLDQGVVDRHWHLIGIECHRDRIRIITHFGVDRIFFQMLVKRHAERVLEFVPFPPECVEYFLPVFAIRHCAVARIGGLIQRDFFPIRQRHFRPRHIGIRQNRIDRLRTVGSEAESGNQRFALRIERVWRSA